MARQLLGVVIIGSMLTIVLFGIQGLMRNDYSSLRHPVSSLSIGNYGWIQKFNFIISGSLMKVSAFGLRKFSPARPNKSIFLSIGIAGIGLIGAGLFNSEPIYGYPPSKPIILSQFSFIGHMHDLISVIFFFGLPVASFKVSLILSWKEYSYRVRFTPEQPLPCYSSSYLQELVLNRLLFWPRLRAFSKA